MKSQLFFAENIEDMRYKPIKNKELRFSTICKLFFQFEQPQHIVVPQNT
jgi:hypothetical protein